MYRKVVIGEEALNAAFAQDAVEGDAGNTSGSQHAAAPPETRGGTKAAGKAAFGFASKFKCECPRCDRSEKEVGA